MFSVVKVYKYSSKIYNFVKLKETKDIVSNSAKKVGFGGAKRPF